MMEQLLQWFDLPLKQRQWLKVLFGVSLFLGLVICLLPSEYVEVGPEVSDKVMHASAFFAYALLFDAASRKPFWRFQVPLLLVFAALIEILQSFTPWRSFSVLDFVADAAGIALYWLLFRVLLKSGLNRALAQR